jgi:hypothetical protein
MWENVLLPLLLPPSLPAFFCGVCMCVHMSCIRSRPHIFNEIIKFGEKEVSLHICSFARLAYSYIIIPLSVSSHFSVSLHNRSPTSIPDSITPEIEAKIESEMPNEFKCPITCDIMSDPVIAWDGHSYERAAIKRLAFFLLH